MHTGVISFCDRVAYNIKSSDTKDVILNQLESLYQIKILQRHWHSLTEETVKHVYRAPHLACLRSNGNPYYIYFSRYEDVPIIYYIDKKVQPGYQKPRIILARGMFDEAIFDGTVMEGEMVKDKMGQWLFLINDVIGYKGKYLKDIPLPKRLEHAYSILDSYRPDPFIDVCTYQVKCYCYATTDGLDNLIALSEKLPYTNRGIYYWPFFLQYKPKLYNFDDSVIKEVHRKVKDNPEFREKKEDDVPSPTRKQVSQPTIIANAPKEGESVMWLRKTENPDVYDIYAAQNGSNKLGVAHVPTLATSRMLRKVFKDLTVTISIPFMCKFNDKFQKYEPISQA
jgi:hypothetical protein